jgi:hypothetical protein
MVRVTYLSITSFHPAKLLIAAMHTVTATATTPYVDDAIRYLPCNPVTDDSYGVPGTPLTTEEIEPTNRFQPNMPCIVQKRDSLARVELAARDTWACPDKQEILAAIWTGWYATMFVNGLTVGTIFVLLEE